MGVGAHAAGLAAGAVILAGFVAWEWRRRAPLLDPRVFARRGLAAGSLSIFVQFFALFGFIFIVLQYLQLIRGDSGLVSAVSMLPMAATMMPAARLAPALVARLGARKVCATGLALIAAAMAVLSQLTPASGYWLLAIGLVVLGAGMGLATTPATSGITSALPAAQQGVGSALNDLSRETGGAVGIAVLASVLTATYQSHLSLADVPAAQAGAARSSVAVATRPGRHRRRPRPDGLRRRNAARPAHHRGNRRRGRRHRRRAHAASRAALVALTFRLCFRDSGSLLTL